MNAFGLYYNITEEEQNPQNEDKSPISPQIVDLHINIWKIEKGKLFLNPEIYIDFGIMFSFKVRKLCIYLPFEIESKEDLGKKLNNRKKVLCAIFNDELLPEPQINGCYCKVKYDNDENNNHFYLYELGDTNIEEKITNNANKKGTYITLIPKGYPDGTNDSENFQDKKRYIRFRVKVKNREDVAITSHISNDLLQAAFSMSDYYDIRINEKRELPDKVKEDMQAEKFKACTFNKVHLFYMADSREKIENESSLKCDSRLLESCQWKDYEPKTDIYNPVFIAHHWKKRRIKEKGGEDKNDIEPIICFSVFFNTIYPKLSLARLFCYIFVVILLSWLGSMLSFNLIDINDLKANNFSLFCLVVVVMMTIFIIGFIIKTNFTIKPFKIFRKK